MIYEVESLTAEFRGRTETIDRSRPEGLEWPVDIGFGAVPQDWRDLAELAANIVGFAWMGVAEIWDAGDRIHEVAVRPGDDGLAEVELRATLMDKDSETRHPLAVRAVVRERER